MPHIATSCCVLKASVYRNRSCILWYPVSHGSCDKIKDAREAGRHKRCFTPFLRVSYDTTQGFAFDIRFHMVSCRRSKGTGLHPRRLITSCSRLARAPREHTASPFLCATMARIQRRQEADMRWTVKSPPALCRDRTIAHYFVMSAIVCAYLVSDFVGRFNDFFLSFIFSSIYFYFVA